MTPQKIDDALKPCPFCGGKAYFAGYNITSAMDYEAKVICKDCSANVSALGFTHFTEEGKRINAPEEATKKVIKKWNNRIDKPQRPVGNPIDVGALTEAVRIGGGTFGKGTRILWKCSVCDGWLNSCKKPNYCENCGTKLDWSEKG